MADPLASLSELTDRLDWLLDDDEQRIAASALVDASIMARHIGDDDWTANTVPPIVKTHVLRACKRYMDNPQGYMESRAGDEDVRYAERRDRMGDLYFTASEMADISAIAGGTSFGFGTINTFAWGTKPPVPELGYVPVYEGGHLAKPFPMYPTADGPW